MYTLKGFAEIPAWIENGLHTTAQFGELTPSTRTFAKDKGFYEDITSPHSQLVAFTGQQGTDHAPVPDWIAEMVLKLNQWVISRSNTDSIPSGEDDLYADIMAEWGAEIKDLNVSTIKTDSNSRVMPTRLTYSAIHPVDPPGTGNANSISVWFEEDAFIAQYDDYIIEVIGPVVNLDDMFLHPTQLGEKLALNTTKTLMERIRVVAGEYPQTVLRSNVYNRIYVTDRASDMATEWTVLIYGLAGLNEDTIKSVTAAYVLANSTHDYGEWAEILPDLFKSTEYIIIPEWEHIAIPQRTIERGMFSPIVPLSAIRTHVDANVPQGFGYTSDYLDTDVITLGHVPWRSMAYIAVGGPENRDDIRLLNEQIVDYIAVPTSSVDFNRMSPETQEWANMLSTLLRIAEDADFYSNIPVGYVRIIRDGKVYIARTHERVLYLTIAKISYTA